MSGSANPTGGPAAFERLRRPHWRLYRVLACLRNSHVIAMLRLYTRFVMPASLGKNNPAERTQLPESCGKVALHMFPRVTCSCAQQLPQSCSKIAEKLHREIRPKLGPGGRSWAKVEPTWAELGQIGAKLNRHWPKLANVMPKLAQFGQHLVKFSNILFVHMGPTLPNLVEFCQLLVKLGQPW